VILKYQSKNTHLDIFSFLLSMNEVIRYWFRDLKKKLSIFWTKNFVRPHFERYFQVIKFIWWITEGIGASFYFCPQIKIPSGTSHTNIWLLFHFHVKHWPLFMLLGSLWCKILCWAQRNTLDGVKGPTKSEETNPMVHWLQGTIIRKKNYDFISCLFWYAQQQNPYKQTSVFVFIFSMLLLSFY
jgi:hypothetical protein